MGKKKGKGKNAAAAAAKTKSAEPVKALEPDSRAAKEAVVEAESDGDGVSTADTASMPSGAATPSREDEADTMLSEARGGNPESTSHVASSDDGSAYQTSKAESQGRADSGKMESNVAVSQQADSSSVDEPDVPVVAAQSGEQEKHDEKADIDTDERLASPAHLSSADTDNDGQGKLSQAVEQPDEVVATLTDNTQPRQPEAEKQVAEAHSKALTNDNESTTDRAISPPDSPVIDAGLPRARSSGGDTETIQPSTTTHDDTTATARFLSDPMIDDTVPATTKGNPADVGYADDHPTTHETGAELGSARPVIFRKASEENVWGSKRQLADFNGADGDIGASGAENLGPGGDLSEGMRDIKLEQDDVDSAKEDRDGDVQAAGDAGVYDMDDGDIGAGTASPREEPIRVRDEDSGETAAKSRHDATAVSVVADEDDGDMSIPALGAATSRESASDTANGDELEGVETRPPGRRAFADSTPVANPPFDIDYDDNHARGMDPIDIKDDTEDIESVRSASRRHSANLNSTPVSEVADAPHDGLKHGDGPIAGLSNGVAATDTHGEDQPSSFDGNNQSHLDTVPSFRSINPSSKPIVPASRAIAIGGRTSSQGEGDHEDGEGDMAEVPISLSPSTTQHRETGIPGGDGANGVKSPTKRSWFSFGRKKTDEKVHPPAQVDSDKHVSEDKGEQADEDVPYGYARPPMSTRSLSSGVQSVHSIHSTHSAYSGRSVRGISSQMASEAGDERASRPGSARPSEAASPVPTTADTEGASKSQTPRRHAPAPHPFPFLIPPSPKRATSGGKLPDSDITTNKPAPANDAAEASTAPTDESAPNSVAAAAATIVPQSAAHQSAPSASDAPPTTKVDHGIGAKGISTFEKVMNYTRPQHLPPKTREEDDIHYHQWEEMMAVARQHQAEKRRAAELRRMEKEKKLAAFLPKWEMLLQGGTPSLAKVREDAATRAMWFQGVPGHLRNKAWSAAIGNPLAMSKDAYRSYVSRASKAISSGRFPQDTLDMIERDMNATLPQTKMFVAGSPMRIDLQELLTAWVVYRSDDGLGYAPYVSHIAAMLLIPSPPAQAFLNLVNLLSRPCLRAFVTETRDEIDAFYRVFENLQADTFPKIYANCSNLGLRLPQSYFRSVLVEQVPFEACCRLWDQIVLDGDGYIFRAALAIFGFLEPRLHFPDKEEIQSVLEGRNKATHAITEREKERARLRGEAYDDELDGKLSVFGLNEDALFEWLAHDEWKEARYERLVTREMPD